jgi:hypothetical protein
VDDALVRVGTLQPGKQVNRGLGRHLQRLDQLQVAILQVERTT